MNLLRFMELSYPVCYMGFYVRKTAAFWKCQRYSKEYHSRGFNLHESERSGKSYKKTYENDRQV